MSKGKIYCGICNKEVKDWDNHSKSKEHLKNFLDPEKILKTLDKHIEGMKNRIRGKLNEER